MFKWRLFNATLMVMCYMLCTQADVARTRLEVAVALVASSAPANFSCSYVYFWQGEQILHDPNGSVAADSIRYGLGPLSDVL